MKEGGAAGLLNEGGGAAGLLNEGGGEQQASCLVAKQAVEFPQVYTSPIIILCMCATFHDRKIWSVQPIGCNIKPSKLPTINFPSCNAEHSQIH